MTKINGTQRTHAKCNLLPTFDYKGVSFIVFSGLSFQYHQTFDATRSARCKMQLRYCSFRVASSETTLNLLTAGAMHPFFSFFALIISYNAMLAKVINTPDNKTKTKHIQVTVLDSNQLKPHEIPVT